VIASVMLMIGSLSSVAVPRLSGQLIDISINYAQSGEEAKAKQQANGDARCIINANGTSFCLGSSVHNLMMLTHPDIRANLQTVQAAALSFHEPSVHVVPLDRGSTTAHR